MQQEMGIYRQIEKGVLHLGCCCIFRSRSGDDEGTVAFERNTDTTNTMDSNK